MLIVGLTGTIGAGKSTVAGWLRDLGAWTIDADTLVHRLYASDAELQQRLAARFGSSVVSGGQVDRRALAAAVFQGDEAVRGRALADLEAIVHPAVQRLRDVEVERARRSGAPVCVYEASKLVESGSSSICDELWIVLADERTQLRRLAARGVAEDEARRRLAAQGTLLTWTASFLAESARLGRTRPIVLFDNSGAIEQGQAQARRLWPAAG